MPTLYDLTADVIALDELLDERGGDISDPEIAATLEAFALEVEANRAAKLDGCVSYIRHLEMEASAARAEADQWTAKAKSRETRIASFKGWLKTLLERSGQTKCKTLAGRTVSVQANGGKLPVVYTADDIDPATIPDSLCRIRREIDRSAVAAALEAGETLAFAALGPRGTHLRIA